MNIEFLLLAADYFRIIKRRDFLLDWLMPILFSFSYFYLNLDNCKINEIASSISSTSISLLGVLVGFSIAVITLLITANTKNIEEIKELVAGQINQYRSVSLFDLMIITYTYSVIMEIILIIFNLFLPAFVINSIGYNNKANFLISINMLFISHVLFVTIRNVTNFYFILIKK